LALSIQQLKNRADTLDFGFCQESSSDRSQYICSPPFSCWRRLSKSFSTIKRWEHPNQVLSLGGRKARRGVRSMANNRTERWALDTTQTLTKLTPLIETEFGIFLPVFVKNFFVHGACRERRVK
jgi:hypothetical protein